LASNVRKRRIELGWTQAKLAEEMDIHPTYLGAIEGSRKFPSSEMLERLCDILGLRPYELFLDEKLDTNPSKAGKLLRDYSNALIEEIPEQIKSLIISKAGDFLTKK
jgi:transcriptional regulator with XRE-family HTH domain